MRVVVTDDAGIVCDAEVELTARRVTTLILEDAPSKQLAAFICLSALLGVLQRECERQDEGGGL